MWISWLSIIIFIYFLFWLGIIIQWNWILVSPQNCLQAEMLHYLRKRSLISLGASPRPNYHHGTLWICFAVFGGGWGATSVWHYFPFSLTWFGHVSCQLTKALIWFICVKLQWIKVLLRDEIDLNHRKGSCSEDL